MNLQSGMVESRILIGDSDDGQKGLMLFGGISSVTKDNLALVTGSPDKLAAVIDLNTSEIVDKFYLDHVGSAPPVYISYENCDGFLVVESGGRFTFYNNDSGFKISLYKRRGC
jgi:hypothetical protein